MSLITRTFSFTSVSASSDDDQSFAIPEAVDFLHIHKVTVTPSIDAGTVTVKFFKDDTFAAGKLVYELGPGSTKLYDPASYDGATYTELLEGYLFPYEDEDASNEFHIRVNNGDSQVKDIDVVVTYSSPLTSGSTSLSALTIDGSAAEALIVRKAGDTGDVFIVDTSNVRVGIGITPATIFHVYANNPELRLEDSDGNYSSFKQIGTSLFIDSEADTGTFTFRDSSSNIILDMNIVTRVLTVYVPNATVTPDFNSGLSFELDESGNLLRFRVKYAAGTAKSGTVALT